MMALSSGFSWCPAIISPPNIKMVTGANRVSVSATARRAAKAMVKLSRYRPSGTTHNIGTATMSVVR